MAHELSRPFDLSQLTIGLTREGVTQAIPSTPGPPKRIDGYTIGAPVMTRGAPHGGEMHPDGDEVLFIVSGRVSVTLELEDGDQTFELGPGQSIVVPRGIWHRVDIVEPTQLVHITPGPGGEHRPLR